ncbi:MAG: hypothetical protein IJX65_05050 [Alistipes sp.]|nr:hypothetical protein [Alistipes sp.]
MENKEQILNLIKNHIIPVLKVEEGGNRDTASNDSFSYVQQRAMINRIFKSTSEEYNQQSIMLRLIVIDSLYSTNAAYSYFSFEEMAKKIYELGKTEESAAQYFYDIVEKKNNGEDLFSANYGIRKNLANGSKQMSLMSKYAYYALLQNPTEYPLGFPIYDSLAIKMYCNKLSIPENKKFTENQANNNNVAIKVYISALNELREAIFDNDDLYEGYQQYDLLDAYLWRMGKLDGGNYSLLLERKDYEQFITNLGLNTEEKESRTKYNSRIFDPFKNKQLNNKKGTKDKDGNVVYSYDFNDLVRYKCATMDISDILKGIKNEHLLPMIEHWRHFYVKENEYNNLNQ